MKELYLIESLSDVKSIFGSFQILEDAEPFDQLAIIKFAKIVNNYIHMQKALNTIKN